MNRREIPMQIPQQAVLHFGPGEFAVIKPGTYVVCAVTGQRIALDDLKYWSVDLNEPYASPDAVLKRLRALGRRTA